MKEYEYLGNNIGKSPVETYELNTVKYRTSWLIKLLNSGGMQLLKWNANHPALTENVNNGILEGYSFCENETKVLGVSCKPSLDVCSFNVTIDQQETLIKMTILSDIARLFDTLGLIGPVITRAMTFMRELWKLKLNWNDPIPDFIAQSSIQWANSLKFLENFKINRYILNPCSQYIAVHGFAAA